MARGTHAPHAYTWGPQASESCPLVGELAAGQVAPAGSEARRGAAPTSLITVRFCAKMVGVIGFEPTTPSSRTISTYRKYLILLDRTRRKPVNEKGNCDHFCAETVPTERDRLEALLRVAAAQWAHKSPADQEIERRFIARDFALISGQRG
jgi:hypothetical protein